MGLVFHSQLRSCLFCPFTSIPIICSSYFFWFFSYASVDPAYFVEVTSLLVFSLRYASQLSFNRLLILGKGIKINNTETVLLRGPVRAVMVGYLLYR